MWSRSPILLLVALSTLTLCVDFSNFQVTKVDKTVNLNGAYPNELDKIQYSCKIAQCSSHLHFLLTEEDARDVTSISFTKDRQSGDILTYTQQNYQHDEQNYVLYNIDIKNKLRQSETITIVATISYINRYTNFPASIDLTEQQKFEYSDNKKFLAPYPVGEQTITYKFTKIIGFEADGQKKGLSMVTFKAASAKPFQYVAHKVHGVNNEPQVIFTQVLREIEVSQWGNIAITQFYKIKNVGPELKGEFSRVQFSSNNRFQAKNTWRGIQTILPYEIWGLYYRDQVGNISTSKAYRDHRNEVVKLGLKPRYGLLGGWKANWEIGYNLNTKGFLTHDGNHFELNKIPLEYALSTVVAEKYTIKVILPEGSAHVKLNLGGNDKNHIIHGTSFGYLDFEGRPTFTIENVKGNHKNQFLKVNYDLDQFSVLKKPLLVFGAIFSILILIIAVKRINMSAFDQNVKTN